MRRIMNACSVLLFGFSLFAFTLGVGQGFTSAFGRQSDGLRSQELIRSIGDIGTGEQVVTTIALENPSSRAITVLGSSRVCHPLCCVRHEGPPQRIPAQTQGTVQLRLFAGIRTGEFQIPVTLYTDCDGQPELTIEVRGRVAAGSPALTSTLQ